MLPSFRKPPVSEVALAVSFEPIEGLNTFEIFRLYEHQYKADLPRVEEKPVVMMPKERFGPARHMPEIQIQLGDVRSLPRYWFLDKPGVHLVQVQRDWLARNWRRTESRVEYPRYPRLREDFEKDLNALTAQMENQGLGGVVPVQCEISYVNEIRPMEPFWSDHSDISAILRVWCDEEPGGWLAQPEEAQVSVSYVIAQEGEPIGRLRVILQPAFSLTDQKPIYVMNLTARGAPRADGIDGVFDFLDIGHEWIVRAFDSLTTDAMHDAWEKE